MDAVNVNKLAEDMRHELIDPRTQKMREWIHNI